MTIVSRPSHLPDFCQPRPEVSSRSESVRRLRMSSAVYLMRLDRSLLPYRANGLPSICNPGPASILMPPSSKTECTKGQTRLTIPPERRGVEEQPVRSRAHKKANACRGLPTLSSPGQRRSIKNINVRRTYSGCDGTPLERGRTKIGVVNCATPVDNLDRPLLSSTC